MKGSGTGQVACMRQCCLLVLASPRRRGMGKKMCWATGNCYITSVPPTNATGPSQGNPNGHMSKPSPKPANKSSKLSKEQIQRLKRRLHLIVNIAHIALEQLSSKICGIHGKGQSQLELRGYTQVRERRTLTTSSPQRQQLTAKGKALTLPPYILRVTFIL